MAKIGIAKSMTLTAKLIFLMGPQENLNLYRKIHRALVVGGKLLIRDHVMDSGRTFPPQGTLFAINMLVNTKGGDTYTFDEIRDSLEAAGFGEVKLVRKGERMDCLVEARKG